MEFSAKGAVLSKGLSRHLILFSVNVATWVDVQERDERRAREHTKRSWRLLRYGVGSRERRRGPPGKAARGVS